MARRKSSNDYLPPEEGLDPRVKDELENLNRCTDEINSLEVQLEDANMVFRSLLTNSTQHLKSLSKKLGACIEKARPYYEAADQMTRAQTQCQQAAVQFRRASDNYAAAKETISLAEERFLNNSGNWQFNSAWQEMLNHATTKVMEAEKQRTSSEKEHLEKSAVVSNIESKVKRLENKLKKYIIKSKHYFEQKDIYNKALNAEKVRVGALQAKVNLTKSQYAKSLSNLEDISESIHARRKLTESRLENLEYDSLVYDLSNIHLRDPDTASIAATDTDLSGSDVEARDSAFGSTSNAGDSVSEFGKDVNLHAENKEEGWGCAENMNLVPKMDQEDLKCLRREIVQSPHCVDSGATSSVGRQLSVIVSSQKPMIKDVNKENGKRSQQTKQVDGGTDTILNKPAGKHVDVHLKKPIVSTKFEQVNSRKSIIASKDNVKSFQKKDVIMPNIKPGLKRKKIVAGASERSDSSVKIVRNDCASHKVLNSKHQEKSLESKHVPAANAPRPLLKVGSVKPSYPIKSKKRKSLGVKSVESKVIVSEANGLNQKPQNTRTKVNDDDDTSDPPWRTAKTPKQRSDVSSTTGNRQPCSTALKNITAQSVLCSNRAFITPGPSKIRRPGLSRLHSSASQLPQRSWTSICSSVSRPRPLNSGMKNNPASSPEFSRQGLSRSKSSTKLPDIKEDVRKPLFCSRVKAGDCKQMPNLKGRVKTQRPGHGA